MGSSENTGTSSCSRVAVPSCSREVRQAAGVAGAAVQTALDHGGSVCSLGKGHGLLLPMWRNRKQESN